MWLIAIDEAGYGPKLGPMVIAATLWRLPLGDIAGRAEWELPFEPLRVPRRHGGDEIRVDDSKRLFRSGPEGMRRLHTLVTAGYRWIGGSGLNPSCRDGSIAAEDRDDLSREPWYGWMPPLAPVAAETTESILVGWPAAGVRLVDVQLRVLTAGRFNASLAAGGNKADLLTRTSLDLIRRLTERHPSGDRPLEVCCDRHGGRRFYAAALQEGFPGADVRVESETAAESVYRVRHLTWRGGIRFTVRGDRFVPVAMSSLFAKYWRERAMAALNAFFAAELRPAKIRPTAGYPSDAKRFIAEVSQTCQRLGIADADWIRVR